MLAVQREDRAEAKVALGLSEQLDTLQATFCEDGENMQNLMSRLSKKKGAGGLRTHFPTQHELTQTATNISSLLNLGGRSQHKQALIAGLFQNVSPAYVSNLTKMPYRTTIQYHRNVSPDASLFTSKYPQGVERKSHHRDLEATATINQAQGSMYQKSGAISPVWLLSMPIEKLYLTYRREYPLLCLEMLKADPSLAESSCERGQPTLLSRNLRLVAKYGRSTLVEPWCQLIARVKVWVKERKAAGLSATVNPRCIGFNGTTLQFTEVTPLTPYFNLLDFVCVCVCVCVYVCMCVCVCVCMCV
jgi:hypothetical protein